MDFIKAYCESWDDEWLDAVTRFKNLYNAKYLNDAVGDDLDNIANFHGITRFLNEYDDNFRNRIKSIINRSEGGGTAKSIIDAFTFAYNTQVEIVDETTPADFIVLINLYSIGGSSVGISDQQVRYVIETFKAVGTNYNYSFYVQHDDVFSIIDSVLVSPGSLTFLNWNINNWDEALWAPAFGFGTGVYDQDAYNKCVYG
jgi:hypothetical protein